MSLLLDLPGHCMARPQTTMRNPKTKIRKEGDAVYAL